MADNQKKPVVFETDSWDTTQLLLVLIAIVAFISFCLQVVGDDFSILLLVLTVIIFALALGALIGLVVMKGRTQARQTTAILNFTRQMLSSVVDEGLTAKSATRIAKQLTPIEGVSAVAVTEGTELLGWAGSPSYAMTDDQVRRLSAACVRRAISEDDTVIVRDPRDMGDAEDTEYLKAAIARPLHVGQHRVGALLFFYHKPRAIDDVQISLVEGMSAILSIQLSAAKLEQQTELATSMKLKALQNQINPHFLFNTINTIAALIRTDPMKARTLLREFATFYRRTLEDNDLILLSREAEQTYRYFQFELARFGEDRIELIMDEGPGVEDMLVPPFLLQPLVENSVRHAMPAEGKLTITITARKMGDRLIIRVSDNGVGMSEETLANIMHPESSTGAGIAVKNVYDRIHGFFGPESDMRVESELGKGTTVTLDLRGIEGD